MSWFDPIWPTLDGGAAFARRQQQAQDADVAAIGQAAWAPGDEDRVLAEAHLIAAREDDRRTSTDGRASAYLLVIAALIPLLTYLESTVWEQKFGTAPKWVSLPIMAAAVTYVLGAGLWAFRTLNVGAFHTLGTTELTRIWSGSRRDPDLVREILTNARRNVDGINEKVSCIKMAHIFLRRGVVCFSLLILVQVGWYAADAARPLIVDWARRQDTLVGPAPAVGLAPAADDGARALAATCASGVPPSQRASDAMNAAFGALGLRGDTAYWQGLAKNRSPQRRSLSATWDALRRSLAANVAAACGR